MILSVLGICQNKWPQTNPTPNESAGYLCESLKIVKLIVLSVPPARNAKTSYPKIIKRDKNKKIPVIFLIFNDVS